MNAMASTLRRLFKGNPSKATKSLYNQGSQSLRSYMVMPGQPVWMDRRYEQFACEAYIRNVIAHRSVTMISSSAASVWFKLYATSARGGRRELKMHPAITLMTRPNPLQSHGEFFQALYH
jgi:phage portal protein BeeE